MLASSEVVGDIKLDLSMLAPPNESEDSCPQAQAGTGSTCAPGEDAGNANLQEQLDVLRLDLFRSQAECKALVRVEIEEAVTNATARITADMQKAFGGDDPKAIKADFDSKLDALKDWVWYLQAELEGRVVAAETARAQAELSLAEVREALESQKEKHEVFADHVLSGFEGVLSSLADLKGTAAPSSARGIAASPPRLAAVIATSHAPATASSPVKASSPLKSPKTVHRCASTGSDFVALRSPPSHYSARGLASETRADGTGLAVSEALETLWQDMLTLRTDFESQRAGRSSTARSSRPLEHQPLQATSPSKPWSYRTPIMSSRKPRSHSLSAPSLPSSLQTLPGGPALPGGATTNLQHAVRMLSDQQVPSKVCARVLSPCASRTPQQQAPERFAQLSARPTSPAPQQRQDTILQLSARPANIQGLMSSSKRPGSPLVTGVSLSRTSSAQSGFTSDTKVAQLQAHEVERPSIIGSPPPPQSGGMHLLASPEAIRFARRSSNRVPESSPHGVRIRSVQHSHSFMSSQAGYSTEGSARVPCGKPVPAPVLSQSGAQTTRGRCGT